METFQNYVYAIVSEHKTVLGVYPNFKKAYERLETARTNTVAVVDKGDINANASRFEVVRKHGSKYLFDTYVIDRILLTIYPSDPLVSIAQIHEDRARYNTSKPLYTLLTDTL